jgi:hypothetical protein
MDWVRLIDQLRTGDCTPVIGAGASAQLLPSRADLSVRWAERYKYPFADKSNLANVLDYAAVASADSVYVKEMVTHDLIPARAPDFSDPDEPHGLLAEFPISVYLTTNYDDFMAHALACSGKSPQTAVCPWYTGAYHDRGVLDAVPLVCDPSQPLVFHLHGNIHNPRSLVLTEQDYLEFLIRITRSDSEEYLRIIPSVVLSALVDNPLLFIGYQVNDWAFRVLFHGLLQGIPMTHRRRSVAVMLIPPVTGGAFADNLRRAQDYLIRYLENWNIIPFWGSAADFCREMRRQMSRE